MLAHTACVGIARIAGGNGKHAAPSRDNFVLGGGGGSRGSKGGSSCSGEGEDDDEGADDVLHDGLPLKLYLLQKDLAGHATGVTIE